MLIKLIIYLGILSYMMLSYRFFSEWLGFFLEDEEMKAIDQRFFYGVVLVISAILWPIVVPFAYLELLKFHKRHKAIIDLLINMSRNRAFDD
ncbi:hypothetical protein G7B40_036085 [Aetokthonos hydrillicola Thurmond2011]|jgi:hypothetical protein|uniref:Uncharacterized protein n=1 Tax=Aetokthonos hydrillicola Thurmond2011 TaxID=2712845 RepID=A0AAP5IG88_9CYAN|nr:hypothetical protein [Aetokthonos hydrillicola]MBO3457879.1 hypothetical protein [Aetokthonos hydrillicola CCALA 1050]MBW4587365.1 hypothetical protein [Aetokthonos hydrillicola CCALA 1050]MDR9899934.1 hypothetical protein [Aetokthonos hydrillicola Thurmond2011]